MNLISNCCLNDFLLQKWDLGHTSPFAWADVDFTSFYNLLTDYDNINFWKYELFIKLHPYYRGRAVHGARIDNKVNITYIHYLQMKTISSRHELVQMSIVQTQRNSLMRCIVVDLDE